MNLKLIFEIYMELCFYVIILLLLYNNMILCRECMIEVYNIKDCLIFYEYMIKLCYCFF